MPVRALVKYKKDIAAFARTIEEASGAEHEYATGQFSDGEAFFEALNGG